MYTYERMFYHFLPFGKEKINFELPEEQVAGVLVSHAHEYKAPKSEAELVADALANPISARN